MQKNVGNTDRMIRIIAGVIILPLGAYYGSWWGLVGLVPLFTGLTQSCVLYKLLGINTCKLK
ncbi:YgaP family membrane protein [Psychrobacter piechaudii]|uniref:Inner membrane protein YgaP-like transmembrane domain-containing protein n=1 Tax=Psychrobacter piechaudii TaxID=1945521 RepID=A0A1R4GVW8_9GAMM|nr:DUF2892 domain-containing protein [Psychrobacter piechaudii]SJM72328.1 hypothetical protein A1232T_01679 [Psychrobacter piechaudii]